jgi:integrase
LTPKDIREYQAQREKQGAAPKTINNELQLLHSAILSTNAPDVFRNQEFRDGWKMPEPEADENVHIYSDDEIKLILANATAKWLPNFATVALWTGCRPGELCQITKSDINLEKKTVTFKAITVKGKRGKRKTRHVRLLPPAIEALKNQIEISQDSVYVFPSPRNKLMPLRIETVTEAWAKTMKKVKLEGRFYDLRHTAITRMLEAGMDSRMIREISGHTTTRMIDLRYSHVGSSGVARALDEFYIKSSTLRRQPEILAKA